MAFRGRVPRGRFANCGGPTCPQSMQAAKKLTELGYPNVRAFEEGLEGWKAAGHSIEKPEPVPAA